MNSVHIHEDDHEAEEANLNRMILELKLHRAPIKLEQMQTEEEEENDQEEDTEYSSFDEYLNDAELVATNSPKSRNSSTSDSGCSSSASFISSQDTASLSLSSSLNSSRQSPIATALAAATALHANENKRMRKIVSGVWGRAKNGEDTCSRGALNSSSFISTQTINYGDDCGFICNKRLAAPPPPLHDNDNQEEEEEEGEVEKHLIAKYYFGLADGVSANRLRGYDAKLFPSALLSACTHFIDELKDVHVHTSPSAKLSHQKEELTNVEVENGQEEDEEDDWDSYEEKGEEQQQQHNHQSQQIEYEYEEDDDDEENDCANLNNILVNAHNLVQENLVYGSSTVCLLSLEFYDTPNKNCYGLLSSCNLGDSGYMLIRNFKVMFKSQSQSHRYNAPYQLGCTPPELLEHDLYRDSPDDSLRNSHQLKQGDYLIISSDGLFDNLYEDEIAMIVQEHVTSGESAATAITSDLLDSACQVLVHKASKAGIKKDDILIMLIHID